jgi:hypothetical protein
VGALRTLLSTSTPVTEDAATDAAIALGALHNMLFSPAGNAPAAQRAGRDAGAPEAALAALERHASADPVICERALNVLYVLADCPTVARTAAAGDVRVVRAAVAALREPRARASVAAVLAACHALNVYTARPEALAHHAAAYDAGALDALVGVLRAHEGDADVARIACCAAHFLLQQAPARAAAHAADAALLSAAAVAVAAHLDDARVVQHSCATIMHAIEATQSGSGARRASQDAAGAAGAVEAACAALCRETYGFDPGDGPALLYAASALLALLRGGHAGNGVRAARAAREELLEEAECSLENRASMLRELRALLDSARAAHDAAPRCAAGVACERCAAHVATGALCACPGCDARRRPDGRALARCAGCRGAAYCGPAHQREDCAAHKRTCGAAARR